jgi:hypothetical protein
VASGLIPNRPVSIPKVKARTGLHVFDEQGGAVDFIGHMAPVWGHGFVQTHFCLNLPNLQRRLRQIWGGRPEVAGRQACQEIVKQKDKAEKESGSAHGVEGYGIGSSLRKTTDILIGRAFLMLYKPGQF